MERLRAVMLKVRQPPAQTKLKFGSLTPDPIPVTALLTKQESSGSYSRQLFKSECNFSSTSSRNTQTHTHIG